MNYIVPNSSYNFNVAFDGVSTSVAVNTKQAALNAGLFTTPKTLISATASDQFSNVIPGSAVLSENTVTFTASSLPTTWTHLSVFLGY